ncbi:MAG: hypothetical protein ACFFD8_01545 [Candidatus Thorarchaeota archaeon]
MDGFLIFGVSAVYCIDEQFAVLAEQALGKSSEQIVQFWDRIRRGTEDSLLTHFFEIIKRKGITRAFVEAQALADELSTLYDLPVQQYEDVDLWRRIRQEFYATRFRVETRKLLHEVAIGLTRQAIREASEQSDQLVIQAMSSLDDVEKAQNLMSARLREWYGLHFPEAAQAIENAPRLARLVTQAGHRNRIAEIPEFIQLLSETSVKPDTLSHSMGAEISNQDMKMIQALAQQYLDLQTFREQLENYLDEMMQEIAPNIRGLIGSVIGARFIALTGGIEKLARLPSSTIQVLGAEQALFRALKTGARPPKHGIIFQHTLVHSAAWWQRGKIARILAGKLAIAARIDLFSGEYVADELKKNVLTRIAEVKRKYPNAPRTPSSSKVDKGPPRRRQKKRSKTPSYKRKQPKGRRQK